jgi:hypothetical protein
VEQRPRLLLRQRNSGQNASVNREYIVGRKFQMKRHGVELRPLGLVQLSQKLLMRWSDPRCTDSVSDGLASDEQTLLVIAADARGVEFTSNRQDSSRIRSARNEVADEDDAICRAGRDSSQKVLEFRGAAVYIADPNRAGHPCPIAGGCCRSASERDRPPGRT